MKSLILKDLFNITHHVKTLLFILVVFAFAFQPVQYVCMVTVIAGSLIATTFSIDEYSKWMRYAMIMPVSGKELVGAKYLVQLIFSLMDVLAGGILGLASGLLFHRLTLQISEIIPVMVAAFAAIFVSMFLGSIMIPFIFRFGAEKGRLFLLAAVFVPVGILFLVYQMVNALGITFSEQILYVFLFGSPFLVLLWTYGS